MDLDAQPGWLGAGGCSEKFGWISFCQVSKVAAWTKLLGADWIWGLQKTSLFSCPLNALGEAVHYVSSYPACEVIEIVVGEPVYVAMLSKRKSFHEPVCVCVWRDSVLFWWHWPPHCMC
eukprot:1304840-Amphidinium_carterae.2